MYLGQRFEILQCLIVICKIPRLPKDKLTKQTTFFRKDQAIQRHSKKIALKKDLVNALFIPQQQRF